MAPDSLEDGMGDAVCGESGKAKPFRVSVQTISPSIALTNRNPTMASLCTRCALRLRRVAAATDPSTLPRSFSTSSFARRTHAIPQFADTSNAELDNVLASMRDKHFIPAALTKAQRHLIFGDSKREELTKYPQIIEIAGEKIELKWIDRRTEIPNRTRLFQRVLKLMAEDGSPEAWRNLMPLLVGLRRSRVEVSAMEMERLLRLATKSGNFHEVIVCLRRGDETGMTLQRPEVFEGVLLALRSIGQADGWSQESLERALKASRDVAQLLEMDTHGGGIQMKPDDRRKDPRVIGAYLELSAVFAERYQNGKDLDGRVRAYADRLLYNISHAEKVRKPKAAES